MSKLLKVSSAIIALMWASASSAAYAAAPATARNIVLVHGAFSDGSAWKPVADILRKDGYVVSVVQPPLTSLEDDVAATQRILDRQDGPVVLVGHSYGGAVVTSAGNDSKVASLVYVAAFVPDDGEDLSTLLQREPGASTAIGVSKDGFLFLDPAAFPADFAADVPAPSAEFMALSQMPVAAKAFGTPSASPAWKTKPSYAIVATEDRIINPKLERWMYQRANSRITEVKSSHAVLVSQPRAVADVIEQAARSAE